MAEKVIHPLGPGENQAPLTPEEINAGLAEAQTFLNDVAPHLGRLFGMDLNIHVAPLKEGAGMATDMETGDIVVDPRFFFETGYKSADAASYGILHETVAHMRQVVTNPKHAERTVEFSRRGKPQAVFNNVLEDVAGNNLIHAALPRMKDVASDLYKESLFPEADLTDQPRHLQFLYKILMQEMAPDRETTVLPEVDEAISGLRDYEGQGDLIKYSTQVAKSATEIMPPEEKFEVWTKILYPVYENLLEQDRQDPDRQQQQQDQSNEQSSEDQEEQQSEGQQDQNQDNSDSQSDEQQPDSSDEQGQPDQQQSQDSADGQGSPDQQPSSEGQMTDDERFGGYYQDYFENRHPEPMSEEDHEKFHQHAKEQAAAQEKPTLDPQQEQERMMEQKIQEETGHTLSEQRRYNAEIIKWKGTIQEMRDVFQKVINERVAQKRGLSRKTYTEGAVLDPDRLVQTVIDVRNNIEEPEAFKDYETKKGESQAIGKTDYVFMLDVSGSMQGEKSASAAAATVIGLEGLAALQRDIEEAEETNDVDLDLDIRTAIYTFGDSADCVKPLSTKVTPKERLDAFAAVSRPNGGHTRDYLALEDIEKLSSDSDRRKILITVSDGGSNGAPDASARARQAVDRLRGQGWFVYGISIGSNEAEHLYRPTARRVDDPTKLPDTIHDFIEATIS